MTKYKILIFGLIMVLLLLTSCWMLNNSDDDSSKDKKKSASDNEIVTETDNEGTGTVEGAYDGNADITINQSDGTTQTASTTYDNPTYVFEDVPSGEATITIDPSNSDPTSQTIQVNTDETTYVNPFGSTQEMYNSLKANVYHVIPRGKNGSSTTVADIDTNNPLGIDFYTKEINIPLRSFSDGFPGIDDIFEWFGVIYEGSIKAPVSGTYNFEITCDDGTVLYIDNNVIVNGDGLNYHKTFTGSVDLVAGEEYDLVIKYFQGPKYHIEIVVKVQIPDGEMQLFNMEDFD